MKQQRNFCSGKVAEFQKLLHSDNKSTVGMQTKKKRLFQTFSDKKKFKKTFLKNV